MGFTRTWTINEDLQRQEVSVEGTPNLAPGDLTAHAVDTTNIHGITDTAALVTSADIDSVVVITQLAYDDLAPPNARTLYVIVG
jgi:hypothetical protein